MGDFSNIQQQPHLFFQVFFPTTIEIPGNQTHFFPGNPPKNHPRSSQPGDESQVESVIMRHEDRTTICVSSQATGGAARDRDDGDGSGDGTPWQHLWHVEKTYEKPVGSPLGTVSSCWMHTFFLCHVDFCAKCLSKAVSIVATSPSWSTGSAVLYAISYNHRYVNIAHTHMYTHLKWSTAITCDIKWYRIS